MARILGVLRLIQSRSRWNAQVIADELGCAVRKATVIGALGFWGKN